jgi:methylmalonyl-CoA/ethylmalonyl-CoA epimerase
VHPFSPLLRFREVVVATREPEAAAARWSQLFAVPAAHDTAVWLGDAWLRFVPGHPATPTRAVVEAIEPDAVAAAAEGRGVPRATAGAAPELAVTGVPITLVPPASPAGAVPSPGGVARIHHVVVAVDDESTALSEWRAAFDFRPAPEGPQGLLVPHHVPVGDAWFGVTSRGTDPDAVKRFVARRGAGVYAIALVVADRADAVARVVDAGGQVLGAPDDVQVFVHPRSTHGVLVELLEEWPGGIRRHT